MASSGKGTNAPTAAEDDKFEELLAGPGCCSGWQGQAKNKAIFLENVDFGRCFFFDTKFFIFFYVQFR